MPLDLTYEVDLWGRVRRHYETASERALAEAAAMQNVLLSLQEKDGSWWDYPLYDYGHAYGTGYALMALGWCRDSMK